MKNLGDRPLIASGTLGFSAAVVLLALILLASGANAQVPDDVHIIPNQHRATSAPIGVIQPQQESNSAELRTLLRVHVDLVLVPVTVTDGMNHPVTGLSKSNFTVYEDNQQQHIRYFSTEDSPMSVGIVLDVSGTMSNKIDAAREALRDFFTNAHPDDDYFVITFADHPQLVANATRSIGDIEGSLTTVKPFGYTALLDAIHMGLVKLRSAQYERRALLIISDGGDNSSRLKLRDVKDEIEESGVEVYAIGLFDDGLPFFKGLDEKIGKHLLNEVTQASGGRTVTVGDLAKLPEIAAAISTEMRNQYILGYEPANTVRNGRWRRIKVRVATALAASDDRRLHPAYKRGYMAPLH